MVRVLDFGEFQPKSAADKGAGRHWKLVVRAWPSICRDLSK